MPSVCISIFWTCSLYYIGAVNVVLSCIGGYGSYSVDFWLHCLYSFAHWCELSSVGSSIPPSREFVAGAGNVWAGFESLSTTVESLGQTINAHVSKAKTIDVLYLPGFSGSPVE